MDLPSTPGLLVMVGVAVLLFSMAALLVFTLQDKPNEAGARTLPAGAAR